MILYSPPAMQHRHEPVRLALGALPALFRRKQGAVAWMVLRREQIEPDKGASLELELGRIDQDGDD